MPVYDIHMEAAGVISHCGYKHDFGCECWRRDPACVAARKASIRERLGHEVVRPLP